MGVLFHVQPDSRFQVIWIQESVAESPSSFAVSEPVTNGLSDGPTRPVV